MRSLPRIVVLLLALNALPLAATTALRTLSGADGWRVTATGSARGHEGAAPGLQPVYWPVVVTHTGSSLATSCIVVHVLNPGPDSYASVLQAAKVLWARVGFLPRCGEAPSPAIIVSLWRETLVAELPRPSATVHPARGIVGLPLVVTATGNTAATFQRPTPAGPLVVEATGALGVTTSAGSAPREGAARFELWPDQAGLPVVTPIETWAGSRPFQASPPRSHRSCSRANRSPSRSGRCAPRSPSCAEPQRPSSAWLPSAMRPSGPDAATCATGSRPSLPAW